VQANFACTKHFAVFPECISMVNEGSLYI